MNTTHARRHLLALFLSVVALILVTPVFASPVPQKAGQFTEYAIPGDYGDAVDITLGPDGNFWFLDQFDQHSRAGKIGKVTPGGSFITYPIPLNYGVPGSITTGPDGNLWFTEVNVPPPEIVGRITPGGQITLFPLPVGTANDITTGPDGNLWFTMFETGIGRITPKGKVTIYSLHSPCCPAPAGITAGPDGNLWFVEMNRRQIGKIDPRSGKITEYPLPEIGNSVDITPGPQGDHHLWFTELTAKKIANIDPTTGKVTEYPVPGSPENIIASRGFLWFTDTTNNAIGRLSLAGQVTEFSIPTPNSNPQGITTSPHGLIWFTEYTSNKIGKMSTH